MRKSLCHRFWFGMVLCGLIAAVSACGGGESRKARFEQQGRAFMADRNYAKARLEFRNALQIDPKDAELRALTGFAAEKLGDYEEAVRMYRVALAADENLVLARARLARIIAASGMTDDADELVSPGLEHSPRSADLLSVRAVVSAQRGDMASALKDARQAVEFEPANTDAITTLAGMLWRSGEREQALALLRQAVASHPDEVDLRWLLARLLLEVDQPAAAEEQLIEVVRLEPKKQEHRYLLAQVYVAQKKVDSAIATMRDAAANAPADVNARIAVAQLLASHRSFDEAEATLAAYRRDAPDDLALQLGIAEFYQANGREDKARSAYAATIEQADDRPEGLTAKSRLAAVNLRAGQYDAATELIADVLRNNPTDADALATRADISLARGDSGAAVADLRAALGTQPDSVPLAVALARAHMQAGEVQLAEQALRSSVQANPRNVQARFALAEFLMNAGRPQQAQPVLEQLVAEQPNNVLALQAIWQIQTAAKDVSAAQRTAMTIQALQPRSATGFVLAGQTYEAAKQVDQARSSYEQAATADPAAPEPIVGLARLDVAADDPGRALARLDERLKTTPENAILQATRGDVLMQLERPEEAARSYAAAARSRPSWAAPYRGQALALQILGQPESAIDALKSGIEGTGGAPELRISLANVYVQLGRVDDAIKVYEAMLDRNPTDDGAANNLAMLLVTHRTDTKSLERAGVLVERFSKSEIAAYLDTRGWVLYKLGRYPDAVTTLERAVAKAPAAQEFRYHLGMAQVKAGRKDAARENLRAAVASGAKYPGVEEAQEVLGTL